MRPPLTRLDQSQTHRLIPSNFSTPVLDDLYDNADEAADVFALDGRTNDRLLAEADQSLGINRDELVFHVPNAHIINAAFTHPRPGGGRFNAFPRGAWYAGFALETALAEVTWHHTRWLREIDHLVDDITKDDWLADFHGAFDDLRGAEVDFAACLDPDPLTGYPAGQALAQEILQEGGIGVVYPSVRHEGGTNIACFRPALVDNVQKGAAVRLIWDHAEDPVVEIQG